MIPWVSKVIKHQRNTMWFRYSLSVAKRNTNTLPGDLVELWSYDLSCQDSLQPVIPLSISPNSFPNT